MYDWNLGDPALNAVTHLRQAYEVMERLAILELEEYRTTLPQLDILMILNASKVSLSPSDIASYVFRELHSVSELLTRMEKAGYVKKGRSKKDQRRKVVQIQPKGKALLEQIQASGFERGRRIFKSSLSGDEIKQLDQLLRKLRDGALHEIALDSQPLPDSLNALGLLRKSA